MIQKSFLVRGIFNNLDGSENLKISYGPEEAEDKSESDPFASSEDTDEEERDGEDSE